MIKFANSTVRLSQAEMEEVYTLRASGAKWLQVLEKEDEVIAVAYSKERQEIAKVYGNLPSMLLKAHDRENGTLMVPMDSLIENILEEK